MKRKKWMGILLAGMMTLCAGGTVWAAEAPEAADQSSPAELSKDLYSFQLEYDGIVYQFPMAYEDFTAQGWQLSEYDDPEQTLTANSYASVGFVKGELSVSADIVNLGINEMPITQCLIGGLSIDGSYTDIDFTQNIIRLPGDITMGQSTQEDIKAAYGEPSDTYEGDNYVKMDYEMDLYQDASLYVYKDDNTLKQVSLRNFIEPEGFDQGTVSEEIPAEVSAYTAPAEIGTELLDPAVEYFGDLYTLPAPVSAFEANGWTMLDVEEGAFAEGGGLVFIDMMKENQTMRFSVYNLTENATAIENCFVTELSQATYDPEVLSLRLSGDIALGADKAELIALAEEKGFLYEDDTENGYLTIYKTEETKLDTSLEVWFNKEESETAAAGITYHNEILPQ